MELPGMAAEELLIEEPHYKRHEFHVKNLDRFFTSMYQYYIAKGLPAVILQQFCNVASLLFTVSFSVFLIAFVDWDSLKYCKDEHSCTGRFLHSVPLFLRPNSLSRFSILVYTLLFAAFWVWRCAAACHTVGSAISMEKFYREKLGLRLSDLQEMRWHEVVQRLIKLHEHGIYRVAIKDRLTEMDVVLRIMRKDNYMIGLINKQLLDLRVPWWVSPFFSERLFLTKSLEWSISFCVMEYMFTEDQFTISNTFLKNPAFLQNRLRIMGVFHMLLLPFMVIFMTIHFFLQNAQQFHSSRAYLGPRQWSPLALWTFREFNELPHVFENRINAAYGPANDYIASFQNTYASTIARFTAYVSGSFVAALLLISFFEEGVLLYVHIAEHNLLWYLGVFSAVFAGARSLIPDETKIRIPPEELIARAAANTHFFPTHWTNRCHTQMVRDEMIELFPYKIHVFAMELLSVLLTPIVLCCSLPSSAQSIIDFVREHSKYVEGVGAVCDYSLFDFERFGDERFGAPERGRLDEAHRPNDGKLEKSFINFSHVHPNWQGDSAGKALMERLHAFRQMMENDREVEVASALQQSMSSALNAPTAIMTNFDDNYHCGRSALTRGFHSNLNQSSAMFGPGDLGSPLRPGPGDLGSPLRPGAATMLSQVVPGTNPQYLAGAYRNTGNGTTTAAAAATGVLASSAAAVAGDAAFAKPSSGAGAAGAGITASTSNGAGLLGGVWGPSGYTIPGRTDTGTGGRTTMQTTQSAAVSVVSLPSSVPAPDDASNAPKSASVPEPPANHSRGATAAAATSTGEEGVKGLSILSPTTPTDSLGGLSPDSVESEGPPSVTNPLLDNSNPLLDTNPLLGAHNQNSSSPTTSSRQQFAYAPDASFGYNGGDSVRSFMSANPMMRGGGGLDQSSYMTSSSRHNNNNMPSILRSVLKQEGIEYENDFYWMSRFNQERARCPDALERSLCLSQQHHNNNYNNNSMLQQFRNGNHSMSQSMTQSTTNLLPEDSSLGIGFASNVLNALESSNFTFASPKASMFTRQLPGARQSALRQQQPPPHMGQPLPSPYPQQAGGGAANNNNHDSSNSREVSEHASV